MSWQKPHFTTASEWFRVVFFGLLIGAADIVPGISGGTIAFILGVYEDLLNSISSFRLSHFKLLLKGKFREFFTAVSWQFLLGLLTGVAIAFLTLAHLFVFLLNHPVFRIWLYATFIGLVGGSIVYCSKQIKGFSFKKLAAFFLAAILAFFLTTLDSYETSHSEVYHTEFYLVDPWIICCGILAVSAMLLPGISGSYMLTVLGMYGCILGSLLNFLHALSVFQFDWIAFRVVFSMGLGILLGACLFSKAILFLLHRYREITIAALIGFMVGSLRAVWPFWSYRLQTGATLQVIEPILPELILEHMVAPLFVLAGFGLVLLIEKLASRNAEFFATGTQRR